MGDDPPRQSRRRQRDDGHPDHDAHHHARRATRRGRRDRLAAARTTRRATTRRTTSSPRAALADGIPATNWQTECYGDRYFGKEGVGLVVNLAAPAAGTLSFNVTTAPFQLFVYASDDATIPADIADWGAADRLQVRRRTAERRRSRQSARPPGTC